MTKPTREEFENFVMRRFRFKKRTSIFNKKFLHRAGAWSGLNTLTLGPPNRGFFLYLIRNFEHLENILSAREFVNFMSVVFTKARQKNADREEITSFQPDWVTPRQIEMQFNTMQKFIVLWKNFYDKAEEKFLEKIRPAINRGIKKYISSEVLTRDVMTNVMPFLTFPGPDCDNLLSLIMI
jgi:hypothetical protein